MGKVKYAVGTVITLILLATAIYVQFDDRAKIKVTEDDSRFYNLIDSRWKLSGTEVNKLFDGTKQVYRNKNLISIWNETSENEVRIFRFTPYRRVNCNITDEYLFDGSNEEIGMFPIHHKVILENCKDLFYRYQVEDLVYDGETVYSATSPASFGNNMKVTWDSGFNWAHIYKSGILKVQWKVPEDYWVYNVRLFDPASNSSNITLSANISEVIFSPNLSLFNISTLRITEYNITPVNQTAGNPLFLFHNNGSGNYTIKMALNDTAPNNHTYKCGTHPNNTYVLSSSYTTINSTLILTNETWNIWCYVDLVGANATGIRTFNFSGSYV